MNKNSKREKFIKYNILVKPMRGNKNFLFGALMFGVILLSMALVSATITFDSPSATGETVTGSFEFNVTSDSQELSHCNFSTTDDGHIGSGYNETDFIINVTIDTSALTDAEDTTLTANCTNSSLDESVTNTLVINLDNTNPTCSFSLGVGEDTISWMDVFGVNPTDASSDTTDLTYDWMLWDPTIQAQETSTSQTPNFASEDFDEIGEFTLGLNVTDEASKTTTCANSTIFVKGTGDNVAQAIETSKGDNTMIIVISIALVLIIVTIIALVLTKKTKR